MQRLGNSMDMLVCVKVQYKFSIPDTSFQMTNVRSSKLPQYSGTAMLPVHLVWNYDLSVFV